MINEALFYEEGPKALLLLHSFSNHSHVFLALANSLRRSGYTVYAPNFSGHNPDNLAECLDFEVSDWLADAGQAVRFLRERGYDQIAVFGLSMGGLIAVKTVLAVGDDSFVGVGTFAAPMMTSPQGTNIVAEFLTKYEAQISETGKTAHNMADISNKVAHIESSLANLALEMAPVYEELDIPVFIAQGGQDEVIDPNIAARFRMRLINADFIAYHFYQTASHYMTIGRQGKDLLKDLVKFLDQLDWE